MAPTPPVLPAAGSAPRTAPVGAGTRAGIVPARAAMGTGPGGQRGTLT